MRRRAPEGSYFADGDRASGVFGVLATGFSVLLGFIIFLAFTSYDQSRTGAETEALAVIQQVETAQFLPRRPPRQLTGELICYARSVAGPEWDRMEAGHAGRRDQPVGGRALPDAEGRCSPCRRPSSRPTTRGSAQTSTREEARRDRIHGAEGVIPEPLWIVLFLISAVIFVYMLFFADSGEGAVTQALLMGSVTAVITMMLLLLAFLDSPFGSGVGTLKPVAMERTLRIADQALGGHRRHRCARPATRRGARGERGTRAGGGTTGSTSSPPCCSPSRRSPRRGAGTRRAAGTASRRRAFSRANAARIESTRASGLADAQTQIDVATFTQWVNAYARERDRARGLLPAALPRRVRARGERLDRHAAPEERRRAPDAVRDAAVPARGARRGRPARGRAEALSAQARADVQRATNYVLAVVLFAATLFFAGMSAKLPSPRLRLALLVMGIVVFTGAVIWIATFPVSLSV